MRLALQAVLVLVAVLAGCGDTADSITVPDRIVVSGAVQEMIAGTQKPCARCALFFHDASPGFLVNTQADPQGNYTMSVPTSGSPLAGAYAFAETLDTTENVFALNVFFAAPLVADHHVDFLLLDDPAIESLEQLAGVAQTTPIRFLIVHVAGAGGAPLAGATVTLVPAAGEIAYTDGTGKPVPANVRTTTSTDGVAYVFDPPDSPQVSVSAPGLSFTTRKIMATPGIAGIAEFAPDR